MMTADEFLVHCGIDKLNHEECVRLVDMMDYMTYYDCSKTYQFKFKIDYELFATCIFTPIEILDIEKKYDFEYKINDNEFQFQVTTYKRYNQIISTVCGIIRYFIYERNPKSIFLKSNPRIEGQVQDRSKHNIHGQCLKMQIYKLPEYDYKELEDGWLIYRKDL